MKKLLCLIIVAAMSLTALTGCGNAATAGASGTQPKTDIPFVPGENKYTDGTKYTDDPNRTTSSNVTPNIPDTGKDSWMASLSGTDKAKLLLAYNRLNENILGKEGNIFDTGEEVMYNLIDIATDIIIDIIRFKCF